MNTLTKSWFATVALLVAGPASADWSANLGWASEYHYCGIFQASSSASGGLDFARGGFYAGTWAADVGDGLEVDGYFGYGREIGDFTYGVGFTGYYYTGDFDDTYQEINLTAGYGLLTLDVAVGEYENLTHGFVHRAETTLWVLLGDAGEERLLRQIRRLHRGL